MGDTNPGTYSSTPAHGRYACRNYSNPATDLARSEGLSGLEHGVVVAAVPWARHGARFTIGFEDTVAWLAAHVALSSLAILQRVSWRGVQPR
jgi:hypothetical protein